MSFFAKHSIQVDIWTFSGKHLGKYANFGMLRYQIVVVAIKEHRSDPESLYADILNQKA